MSSNAVAQYERLTHDVSGAPINKHLPGDLAMWVFIVMELSVFAIFFIAFAVAQRFNESMFSLGRASLDGSVGLFCTLALIISSYLVALAVKAVKGFSPIEDGFSVGDLIRIRSHVRIVIGMYKRLSMSTCIMYTMTNLY